MYLATLVTCFCFVTRKAYMTGDCWGGENGYQDIFKIGFAGMLSIKFD
jgi:hypothetical protein